MGYSQQVASAMRGLGYTIFPFEAFDGAGRVVLPDQAQVPERWTQAIGRVARTPAWSEIYATLSVLDDANPAWRSFMVGVGFAPGQVRIIIFKWLRSVTSPEQGVEWTRSYQAVPAATVQELAGTTYAVDPALISSMAGLETFLEQRRGTPPTPSLATTEREDTHDAGLLSPGPPSDEVQATSALAWALMGVQAVKSLLTAANSFGSQTSVLTTVIWYPGASDPAVTWPVANGWTPLRHNFENRRRRTAHGIWNPTGRAQGLPNLFYGYMDPWRGVGFRDMPHTPDQVVRALHPLGLDTAPVKPAAADADDGASVAFVQILVAAYNAVKKIIEVGKTLILVYKGGKWLVAHLSPGVSSPPPIVYSRDYKRLLYRQADGSYKMGNVILD